MRRCRAGWGGRVKIRADKRRQRQQAAATNDGSGKGSGGKGSGGGGGGRMRRPGFESDRGTIGRLVETATCDGEVCRRTACRTLGRLAFRGHVNGVKSS